MNTIWNKRCNSVTAVDLSQAMLDMLLKLAASNPHFDHIQTARALTRQALERRYNLVMMNQTLSDLVDDSARKYLVGKLWDITSDLMIITDRGTPEGYRCILNARDQVLASGTPCHIVAPVRKRFITCFIVHS